MAKKYGGKTNKHLESGQLSQTISMSELDYQALVLKMGTKYKIQPLMRP